MHNCAVAAAVIIIFRSVAYRPGARFANYLATILRLSRDNAKVTIDLRRTRLICKTSYTEQKAFHR